ncbi:MAG: glutamine--fructose-6-phosphate transaminase (isomerizing) [Pseudomonadota bacterium]
MCGIIGVLGQLEAAPRIMDALKRLEYRGYDSAGLTTLLNGKAIRRRAVGKLGQLTKTVAADPAPGTTGIGHTRWATHGAPTEANAHPHAAGPVHVVHNGIIENFRELRAELATSGITCATETDTEVVVQLAARNLARGMDPEAAATAAVGALSGAYALVFLFEDHPDLLICARHGSPLAIGWGDEEMFVGSDALALSPMTSRITYLEDGDIAIVRRTGAVVRDRDGQVVDRGVTSVSVENALIDKGPHRHFMAKEIAEQPAVLDALIARSITPDRTRVADHGATIPWDGLGRLLIVGCGSAILAGQVAKYWFEQIAGLPVDVDIASEFRYRDPPLDRSEVAIFISQSGETADTLAALRHVQGRVRHTVGILNVGTSTIAREVDTVLATMAGPEIGVASTKAFSCQLVTLALTAIRAARDRGRIDAAREAALIAELEALPALMAAAIGSDAGWAGVCHEMSTARDILYLGRGQMYPIALEGALKLKEISYIHAEGYASGELKHGPIALIDETVPVVVMAPRDSLFEKTVSNMQEVMARGGKVVLVTDRTGADIAGKDVWRIIEMPAADTTFAAILYAIPAQQLAYHTALAKGTDVDQPRNLAKSVTVE